MAHNSLRLNWILCAIFLLLIPGIYWGLPSAVSPQIDSPLPMGSLLFFADRRAEVDNQYPAFHQLFMLPFYAVAFGFYGLAGGLSKISSTWPYGLHDVSGFFSALTLITNLVSAAMGIAMLYLSLEFVKDQQRQAWFALIFIGTSGAFVYYSRVGNVDMPYTLWLVVMLWFIRRFLVEAKPVAHALIPAAMAGALAVASKDQAVGFAIGVGALLLFLAPSPAANLSHRIRNAATYSLALVTTYAVAAILPNPGRWWHHARYVTDEHHHSPIPPTAFGQVQIFLHTLSQLNQTFTIPLLLLCVLGSRELLRNGRAREFWILVGPLIGYYVVPIASTRYAHTRFMLPLMLPVLVLATHGIAWISDRIAHQPVAKAACVAASIVFLAWHFAVSYLPVTYVQMFDLKKQLAADLPGLVPPGQPLLIAKMQAPNFPNRDVYEKYRLMMLPGDPIIPASRHTSNVFTALDDHVAYYLLGTGGAGLPWHQSFPHPPLSGELIKEWRYPAWSPQSHPRPLRIRILPIPPNQPAPPRLDRRTASATERCGMRNDF